jgi:Endonuclease-reverse transcriptase
MLINGSLQTAGTLTSHPAISAHYTCESIYVHNVYNPPPASHTEERDLGTLTALKEVTAVQGEQIILGDFNLHYSLWSGPSYPQQHRLASSLLDIMRVAGVLLALPQGTVTRECKRGQYIK